MVALERMPHVKWKRGKNQSGIFFSWKNKENSQILLGENELEVLLTHYKYLGVTFNCNGK